MKVFLISLLVSFSINANAQADSSDLQIPIRLNLKVKYWAMIGAYPLSIRDSRFTDTLRKCIGSGTALDSVSTGTIRAGRFLQFFQQVTAESSGATYKLLNELLTSTQAQDGWSGLLQQLNSQIANGTAQQKIIALWLKNKAQQMLSDKQAISDNLIQIGISNLLAGVKID